MSESKREAVVRVRATKEERATWHRVAEEHGATLSSFVRQAVRDFILRLAGRGGAA